jgi:hypothetical protein
VLGAENVQKPSGISLRDLRRPGLAETGELAPQDEV